MKRFQETGQTSDGPRKGRPRSVRNSERIKGVQEKVRQNPARSMRKTCQRGGCEPCNYAKDCKKKDLNLIPYKKVKVQLLSNATKAKRLTRSKVLLDEVRSGMKLPILFTDEKLFTIQSIRNSQNDRILAKNKQDIALEDRAVFRRQKPQSVMAWAGVTMDGRKTPLIFIEEGVKVNKDVYLALLKDKVFPWLQSEYFDAPYVITQDGAPAHNANIVQAWCSENFPAFWNKSMWPPSTLTSMSWTLQCGPSLRARLVQNPLSNIVALKASLTSAWYNIPEQVMHDSCAPAARSSQRCYQSQRWLC